MVKVSKTFAWVAGIFWIIGMSGCNFPLGSTSVEAELNVTQAYQTVEARLTQGVAQTALATSTQTPTLTMTSTENVVTPTITAVATQAAPNTPASTVVNCDTAAAGSPIDVAIPDDSQMQPGEEFTKIWRLQNAGTCTWNEDYSAALFSGDSMGAPSSVPITEEVLPGESVDVAVDLIAPETSGTYQGNWKLKNDSDEWFGIGPSGGSAFWVRIVVGDAAGTATSGTPTSDTTPSATENSPEETDQPSETDTANQPVFTSGPVSMVRGDRLDFDTKGIDTGGSDLLFDVSENDILYVETIGNAQMAEYEFAPPTLEECKSLPMSSVHYNKNEIRAGIYFCYRTNEGRYGWLQAISYSEEGRKLSMQLLTWAAE